MKARSMAQIALVVLVAGAAILTFRGSSDRVRIDFDPYRALGVVAAEETVRAVGGRGRIVIVAPDGSDPDPVLKAQLEAFAEALKREGRGEVVIEAREGVTQDPFLRMRTGGALAPEQWSALRERHPGVAGMVLFLGFPALSEEALEALEKETTRCMVVSAALPGYDELLRRGILQFAIVPRPLSAEAPAAPAKDLRALFDREYQVLRSGRAGGGAE